MTDSKETPTSPSAHSRIHPLEWLPVAMWAVAAALLAYRLGHPLFMKGQLLPSVVIGLTPGTVMRLAGRHSLSGHRFGFAAGLILFMVWNGKLDFNVVGQTASNTGYFLPAILLAATTPVFGAARWRTLLAAQDIRISFAQSLRLTLVGGFFNQFVPGATGGDLYRAYHIRAGGRTEAAVTSVVLDRFLGLPPLILIMAVAALLNRDFVTTSPGFRPIIWLVAIVIIAMSIFSIFILWLGSAPEKKAEKIEGRIPGGRTIDGFRRVFVNYRNSKRAVALALLLGLFSHFATIGACCLLGKAAGVTDIPADRYFLIAPAGLTANAVPLSPGGLGQGEVAFGNLFEIASGSHDNYLRGAAVMLCLRIGLLLSGLVGGVLYATGKHGLDNAGKSAIIPPSDYEETVNAASQNE